ncbi:MAG TPA: secretin and TonB N-terminal domain-containing protein, partial [Armatimonadota bacterium]
MISARFSHQVSRWRRLLLVATLLIIAVASFAAEERKIESLDFVDTDVTLVLKSLADISGANIVISPAVTGKLTLKLSDVTLKEALDYITKVNGLAYRVTNDSYIIGPRDLIEKGY